MKRTLILATIFMGIFAVLAVTGCADGSGSYTCDGGEVDQACSSCVVSCSGDDVSTCITSCVSSCLDSCVAYCTSAECLSCVGSCITSCMESCLDYCTSAECREACFTCAAGCAIEFCHGAFDGIEDAVPDSACTNADEPPSGYVELEHDVDYFITDFSYNVFEEHGDTVARISFTVEFNCEPLPEEVAIRFITGQNDNKLIETATVIFLLEGSDTLTSFCDISIDGGYDDTVCAIKGVYVPEETE